MPPDDYVPEESDMEEFEGLESITPGVTAATVQPKEVRRVPDLKVRVEGNVADLGDLGNLGRHPVPEAPAGPDHAWLFTGAEQAGRVVVKKWPNVFLASYEASEFPFDNWEEFVKDRHGEAGSKFVVEYRNPKNKEIMHKEVEFAEEEGNVASLLGDPNYAQVGRGMGIDPSRNIGLYGPTSGASSWYEEQMRLKVSELQAMIQQNASDKQLEMKKIEVQVLEKERDRAIEREKREADDKREREKRAEERDERAQAARDKADAERDLARQKREAEDDRLKKEMEGKRFEWDQEQKQAQMRWDEERKARQEREDKEAKERKEEREQELKKWEKEFKAAELKAEVERKDRLDKEASARSSMRDLLEGGVKLLAPIMGGVVTFGKEFLAKSNTQLDTAMQLMSFVKELQGEKSTLSEVTDLLKEGGPVVADALSAMTGRGQMQNQQIQMQQPPQQVTVQPTPPELMGRLAYVDAERTRPYITEKFYPAMVKAIKEGVDVSLFAAEAVSDALVSPEAIGDIKILNDLNEKNKIQDAQGLMFKILQRIPGVNIREFSELIMKTPAVSAWVQMFLATLPKKFLEMRGVEERAEEEAETSDFSG